jgi:hypothetical protein
MGGADDPRCLVGEKERHAVRRQNTDSETRRLRDESVDLRRAIFPWTVNDHHIGRMGLISRKQIIRTKCVHATGPVLGDGSLIVAGTGAGVQRVIGRLGYAAFAGEKPV